MLDTGDHVGAQSPLAGIILCCTAIGPDEREQLGKWASDMGATHRLDLTSDVTHLIAGQIDTPKYNYVAKERPDVTVVTPAWIEAVRAAWMAGEEPDVAKLENEHRVPSFLGLRICVTGFDNLEQRKYLENSVGQNGGTYQGDLTKNVTHLVAAAPQGKKYEHAKQWQIKTVSLEWLTESVERGMALDERLYNPLMPPEERGKGAWQKPPPYSVALGKRQRIPTKGEEPGSSRRKLRRTASTKLGSQSQSILADIAGGSFTPRQEAQDDSWQDQDQNVALQESASVRKPPTRKTELKKAQSMPNLQPFDAGSVWQKIFEGKVMHITGFDATKTAVLYNILTSNGAQVMKTVEDIVGWAPELPSEHLEEIYLIVPHEMTKDQVNQLPFPLPLLTAVNEWWVEKCLFRKFLVNPTTELTVEMTVCKPFERFPLKGFEDLKISSTSFTDVDLLHLSKVVQLMGATYEQYTKPESSVLICRGDTAKKEKLEYCAEHKIPVISAAWLWYCIDKGVRHPFEPFLIQPKRTSAGESPLQPDTERKSLGLLERRNYHNSAAYLNHYEEERKAGTPQAISPRLMPYDGPLDQTSTSSPAENNPGLGTRRKGTGARPLALSANLPEEPKAAEARAAVPNPSKPIRKLNMPFHESDSEDELDTARPMTPISLNRNLAVNTTAAEPQPLQQLSQSSINSPKKPSSNPQDDHNPKSTTTIPESFVAPDPAPSEPPLKPLPQASKPNTNTQVLNTSIASLLAAKQQSRSATITIEPESYRNRRKKLGRAPSNTSNLSADSSLDNRRRDSNSHPSNSNPSVGHFLSVDEESAGREEGVGAEALATVFGEVVPSQALVWGDGETEGARQRIIRQMGGMVESGGARAVEGVGRVRDVGEDVGDGVATRVGRRGRAKGF